MDDYIAYALVLVALALAGAGPTGGSDAHTTELSLVRRYRRCAALTATHGRTGQVSWLGNLPVSRVARNVGGRPAQPGR